MEDLVSARGLALVTHTILRLSIGLTCPRTDLHDTGTLEFNNLIGACGWHERCNKGRASGGREIVRLVGAPPVVTRVTGRVAGKLEQGDRLETEEKAAHRSTR